MMDWSTVSKELAKPLNPDAIKPPAPGKFGDYVDGLHVIKEANRIFGYNGWSYVVTRLERTHEATVTLQGKNGPYEQYRTSFLCAVRVTIDGVTREGTAVGMGSGKPESAGDVIESAVKEAETDALKRALRTFGNTFGLALYEKDHAKREVGHSATDAEIETAIDALSGQPDLAGLQAYWANLYRNARHVADDQRVVEAKNAKKAEFEHRSAA